MKNLKDLNASNYCLTTDGKLYSLRVNEFMQGWLVGDYQAFSITFDNGERKVVYAHRLVALAFIVNDDLEKTLVNHIDGNKQNNSVNNLEWVTPSDNNYHAYEIGLSSGKSAHKEGVDRLKGDYKESTTYSDLTEEDVHSICKLIVSGYRDVDISRMTNFPRRTVNLIRHKNPKVFYEITSKYTFNFVKEERMSPELVIKICQMLQDGWKVVELSRELNLNRKKVGNIKSRKTFKDISKNFKW